MRKFLRLTMAAACILSAIPSNATDLADAYRDARENDPLLSAAQAGYQARKELVPQARSSLLPRLSMSGQTSWNERSFPVPPTLDLNPSSANFGRVVQLPDLNFNEHSWQARLDQPIVNLSNWFAWRSAKASVEGAGASLEATGQGLIVRVTQAYLDVLRAQDRLDAALAQEAAVKRQLDQVQQRFDVGLAAITDVLEAKAAYDNAVVTRVQADGDHDIFFETLYTMTGIRYDSLDRLAETLPIVNPQPWDEQAWVERALRENPEVAAAEAQLEAAKRTLAARRAGHLPTLDGAITRSHFVTSGAAFFGNKTDTTTWSLSLNLPIYQGGFTHSRAKEARALAEQARQELRDRQLRVSRDTRNLFQATATQVVRVGARLKAIASSESALEATETGYEVGTRNIVDVLQAQQRLFASQFDYADSRYNYVIDHMRLKQVAGALTEQDLQELNRFADAQNPVTRLASLRRRSANPAPQ